MLFKTRASVYEKLFPQHVLAPIDNVEHNFPYGKKCLSEKGNNSVKYWQSYMKS